MGKLWSKQETEILNKMWDIFPIEDIAEVLKHRTKSAIRRKGRTLGLSLHYNEVDLELYKQLMKTVEG